MAREEGAPGFNTTDMGNAERLVARHGSDIRYCEKLNKWFVWDGRRWAIDDTGEVTRRAKDTVRSIYKEASDNEEDSKRQELAKHARASETDNHVRSMIRLAQSEPGIPIAASELDQDDFLFNCENGTINLRTGELQSHRREDYISKLSPVAYDPKATCPRFEAFLDRIMDGHVRVIGFMQRFLGYALSGSTREEILLLMMGEGRNGKSKLIAIILYVMGDYGRQVQAQTLMTKPGGAISNDIAGLVGIRFIAASEIEEGRAFSEGLVKQLTGGDKVSARFLYGEYFEYQPKFKIVLAANQLPKIRGNDLAIWSRIELLRFDVTISKEEQDKQLSEKLQSEAAGVLAWLVEGCLKWQAEGLQEPIEVREATAAYRFEMDPFGEFLESRCVTDPRASVGATEIYKEYLSWCKDTDEESVTQKAFGTKLTNAGFPSDQKGPGGRTRRRGIGLKETHADSSEAPHELPDESDGWTQEDQPPVLTLLQKPS
jgi:putative DNA primase/helicase